MPSLMKPWLKSCGSKAGSLVGAANWTKIRFRPEAGLDQTHIDYHKGCYIGQEVISRLKSVGHVNRSLTGFVSETGAALAAGLKVIHEPSGAQVGTLTSAAYSFALEKPIALGYLKRGSSTDGLIARSGESNAAEIRVPVRTLPFVS